MIVIKGMDNLMPRHCTECWNCDKNFNSDMPKDKWVCLLLMKFADQSGEKRLDDCPLELVADEKILDETPTIKLVYCQDCKNLKHREDLEDNIKRRLPDNLIGHCWRTGVYVRENDYCCGGEE